MTITAWGQTTDTDYTTGYWSSTGMQQNGKGTIELNGIEWSYEASDADFYVDNGNLVIYSASAKGNGTHTVTFTLSVPKSSFGAGRVVKSVSATGSNPTINTDGDNIEITISGAVSNQKKKLSSLTLSPITVQVAVPVEVNSCGNASFCYNMPLDFTNSGVDAYIVTGESETSVTLQQIYKVPANTGIFVFSEEGTYDVALMYSGETESTANNKLIGTTEEKKINGPEDNIWPLSKKDGLLHPVTYGTIAVGKAYLVSSVRSLDKADARSFSFDETPTSINTVAKTMSNGVAYNLAGQRVAANAKGIVIIDGKKYINK